MIRSFSSIFPPKNRMVPSAMTSIDVKKMSVVVSNLSTYCRRCAGASVDGTAS